MAPGEDYESSTRESLLDVVLDKLHKAGKVCARFDSMIQYRTTSSAKLLLRVIAERHLQPLDFRSSVRKEGAEHRSFERCAEPDCAEPRCASSNRVANRAAFYSKIFEKCDQTGEVTGMLMAYPACMVHLLEVGCKDCM